MKSGMRCRDSIFTSLLKPISRPGLKAAVAAHDGDAYDKSFTSWDHLVTLIFAQLAPVSSLRGIVSAWNANAHQHSCLDSGPVARATLADANHRRPPAVFADVFAMLSGLADRRLRHEGGAMLRLIDSTPIPLETLCHWAHWNGRTRGLKMHVVYDPEADHPRRIAITAATVNDVEFGREQPVEAGATYVFDKAYCDYAWWTRLHQAGAVFVTRPKRNVRYEVVRERPVRQPRGDGFEVLADADIRLASLGKSRLACPLRRVQVQREDGRRLDIVTNDRDRPAADIAALYKARWEIELLFRWLKQHLKLARFIGRSENAIKLQVLAAMIAFLLLRIAAKTSRSRLPALRFRELAGQCLFIRKPFCALDKPPADSKTKPKTRAHPQQWELNYA
jgi:IS4 transposase